MATMFLIWVISILLVAMIYILAVTGYLINMLSLIWALPGIFLDIACQLWIDVSKLWKGKVKLDDHEEHLS